MKNNIYNELKKYIDDNHGISENFLKTKLGGKYKSFQSQLQEFDNKKVKLKYLITTDYFGSATKTKYGKIRIIKNKLCFFERGFSRKYYNLDTGLYEGFFATLIVLEIEEIDKFPKRVKKSFAEQYGLNVKN